LLFALVGGVESEHDDAADGVVIHAAALSNVERLGELVEESANNYFIGSDDVGYVGYGESGGKAEGDLAAEEPERLWSRRWRPLFVGGEFDC
jgi:hypothetical protein